MNKKAQLEIMQNAFILLLIFIILIAVFLVLMSKYRQSIISKISNSESLDKYNRYSLTNFLPELRCSNNNIYMYECYDKERILSFKEHVENNSFYYDDLFKKIKFSITIYEDGPGTVSEELLFNNTKSDYEYNMYINQTILVYDNQDEKLKEGILNLEIYN